MASLSLVFSLFTYFLLADASRRHGSSSCYDFYGDDVYEPDDEYTQATTLISGVTSEDHSLTCSDEDWFVFELTAISNGIRLETLSDNVGSDADTKLHLYSNSFNCLDVNDDKNQSFSDFTSLIQRSCNDTSQRLPNGTYYVKVTGYGTDTQYEQYDLLLIIDSCVDDEFEYETCDDLTIVDWDDAFSNGASDQIEYDMEICISGSNMNDTQCLDDSDEVSSDKISEVTISVTVTADYVVESKRPGVLFTDDVFGVTYVLDTDLFDGRRNLWDANECENRELESFKTSEDNLTDIVTFNDYWTYTLQPSNPNELGSNEYLEYPPSEWKLSWIKDENRSCNGYVEWTQDFSLDDLLDCGGFNWEETDEYIEFKGTFYFVLVSPEPFPDFPLKDDDQDTASYYTRTLLTQTLYIRIAKLVNIIEDSYVQLSNSIITNINFYESYFDDDDNSTDEYSYFEVNVLTYVPEWMYLNPNGGDNKVLSPTIYDLMDLNPNLNESYFDSIILFEDRDGYPSDDANCLYEDDTRCWQRFTILVVMSDDFVCQDNEESTVDDVTFSDDYQLQFNYVCDDYTSSECQAFEDALSITGVITLNEMELTYVETCDINVAEFEYEGELSFYEDDTYSQSINPDDTLYSVGDTVYLEASVAAINDTVLGMEIENAYLCTANDDDITDDISSCEDLKDVSNANYYDIINDGDEDGKATYPFKNDYNTNPNDHFERFSFTLPEISRSKFFIEVNALLTIDGDNVDTRRMARLLLESNNINTFKTFFNGGTIGTADNSNNDDTGLIIGIVIGCLILVLIIIGIIVYIGYRKKQREGKDGESTTTAINTTTEKHAHVRVNSIDGKITK